MPRKNDLHVRVAKLEKTVKVHAERIDVHQRRLDDERARLNKFDENVVHWMRTLERMHEEVVGYHRDVTELIELMRSNRGSLPVAHMPGRRKNRDLPK